MARRREIKAHVAKRIALNDVAEAQMYLEDGKARGAMVCMPWRKRKTFKEDKKQKPGKEPKDKQKDGEPEHSDDERKKKKRERRKRDRQAKKDAQE